MTTLLGLSLPSSLLGLLLLGLTIYSSTLSYILRTYSRARFAAALPNEEEARKWLERIDRVEAEMAVSASFLRLASMIALVFWMTYEMLTPSGAPGWTTMLTAAAAALLVLSVFALGIPNALAVHAGEAILARGRQTIWATHLALRPLERALMFIDFLVRRLLGKSDLVDDESERVEQEILDAVSEGELSGAVDEEQREMIQSVFELHETNVSEIMTPRTDIVAVPVTASLDETRATILAAGHSRVPVYENSLDHIIGVLYAKDLIAIDSEEQFDIAKLLRVVPYVPETKSIDALLRELRQERVHIVIVLDEYGGTAGLVTFEDIIEELIGEIDDEYDREAPPLMERIDNDTLEVDARVHIYEINEELDVTLPEDEDYETIGGFVFSSLGKIPTTGEEFTHENIQFNVVDAEARRINRLRIHVERAASARSA